MGFVRDPRVASIGIGLLVFPQMFLAGALIPINGSSGILGLLAKRPQEGTEFLDVLLRKGLAAANEWASSLGEPPVKRRRFRIGPLVALAALVGTGLVLVSRR